MTTDIDAILAQRAELKRRDPEAILLFRVDADGRDLYRAYGDDVKPLMEAADKGAGVIYVPRHGEEWAGIEPGHLDLVLDALAAASKRAVVVERVKGGTGETKCARTACTATRNVVFRHTQTGQLYCPRCARKINEANPGLIQGPAPAGAEVERVATNPGRQLVDAINAEAPGGKVLHGALAASLIAAGNDAARGKADGAGESPEDKLARIHQAVRDYYLALDNREHGEIAQNRAFRKIEEVLGIHWRQGEEKRRRGEG